MNFSKTKIAYGRNHRLEPDSWLQSQTAVAAHTLDLLKINQPSSEGDTHDDSTPSVKMTRQFKTSGPCGCFMTRHLLYIWHFQGVSVAYGPLSDTWWGLTQMASPTMSKRTCLWGKFSSAVWDSNPRGKMQNAHSGYWCTFGILKRGGAYWRITCHFKPKKKIDNIAFTCAMSQHAHWAWQMAGRGHDVAADFSEYSMDHRVIDLRCCPADRSCVGSDNINLCNVEVECEWTQLRGALIESYMHCYRLNKIEWQ